MTVQPLTQRVARAAREGWIVFSLRCIWHWNDGCRENDQHKFWWGCKPWGVGTWRWYYPRKDTWRLGCLALARDKPEHHLVLGWLQCVGQTPTPHGAWVLAKDPIGYDSLAPRGPWKNLSATWRLDGSNTRGRTKRYLALGSWHLGLGKKLD
jgi:flavin-dependent dehydrogenase